MMGFEHWWAQRGFCDRLYRDVEVELRCYLLPQTYTVPALRCSRSESRQLGGFQCPASSRQSLQYSVWFSPYVSRPPTPGPIPYSSTRSQAPTLFLRFHLPPYPSP